MKKLLLLVMSAGTLLLSGSPLLAAPAFAMEASPVVASASTDTACSAIGLSGASCADGANGLSGIFNTIVKILSVVVGIAAVIMIIVSGLKYVTSGGDSNKTAGAKNTLVYAIIGLVIVALAQFIVHFVIKNV